jgi:hypothetical protein
VIGVVLLVVPDVVRGRLGDVRRMLMAHENAQLDALLAKQHDGALSADEDATLMGVVLARVGRVACESARHSRCRHDLVEGRPLRPRVRRRQKWTLTSAPRPGRPTAVVFSDAEAVDTSPFVNFRALLQRMWPANTLGRSRDGKP